MKTIDIAEWMLRKIKSERCIYQDDVVDYIIKSGNEEFLRENSDGNQALSIPILNAFKKLTEPDVVWVKPDKYWRYRVKEDEPGRNARG